MKNYIDPISSRELAEEQTLEEEIAEHKAFINAEANALRRLGIVVTVIYKEEPDVEDIVDSMNDMIEVGFKGDKEKLKELKKNHLNYLKK